MNTAFNFYLGAILSGITAVFCSNLYDGLTITPQAGSPALNLAASAARGFGLIIAALLHLLAWPWHIMAHIGLDLFTRPTVEFDFSTAEGRRQALFYQLYFGSCHVFRASTFGLSGFSLLVYSRPSAPTINKRIVRPFTRPAPLPDLRALARTYSELLTYVKKAHTETSLLNPDDRVLLEKTAAGYAETLAATRNKMMHMLNGNIEHLERIFTYGPDRSAQQLAIAKVVPTSKVPGLGGAVPVMTEFLYGANPQDVPSFRAGGSKRAPTFQRMMLRAPVQFGHTIPGQARGGLGGPGPAGQHTLAQSGYISRPNSYTKSYPVGSGRTPQVVSEDTRAIVLGQIEVGIPANPNADTLKSAYLLPSPDRRAEDITGPRYLVNQAVAAFWDRTQDEDRLKAAHTAISPMRFTGARGNRQVLAWDAQAPARSIMFHALADADAEGSSYFRFFFRLWCQYLTASIEEAHSGSVIIPSGRRLSQRRPVTEFDVEYNPAGLTPARRVVLVPLSAHATPAAQNAAINPEGPLTDPNWPNLPAGPVPDPALGVSAQENISELAGGYSHLLDVNGMDDDMIRLAIWALCPAENRHAWSFLGVNRLPEAEGNVAYQQQRWMPAFQRYQEPVENTPLKIFLHYGSRPAESRLVTEANLLGRAIPAGMPGGARHANPRNSPWSQPPSTVLTSKLISHMIRSTRASNDAWAALDLALLQMQMFYTPTLPTARPNARITYVNAAASENLELPRDYTASAYFDCARINMDVQEYASDVADFFSLPARERVWAGATYSQGLASSLNWASYAMAMRGKEWRVANGTVQPASAIQSGLVAMATMRVYQTDIMPWSITLRAACALMYEYAPLYTSMMAMSQLPSSDHEDNLALWLSNPYHDMWQLKKIPHHMMLPQEGQAPSWPDAPAPMVSSMETLTPSVRVARDSEVFTGRPWVQDGGMMANLQFYASAIDWTDFGPGRDDPLASQGLELAAWNVPYQFELPVAPVTFNPIAMRGIFNSWLLPGSVQSWSGGANRIRALGARLPVPNRGRTQAWAQLTLERKQANVAIHYNMPVAYQVEIEPVNDFSMLVWEGVSGEYVGMTLAAGMTTLSPLPPATEQTGARAIFEPHLANHNAPHVLQSNATLSAPAAIRTTSNPPSATLAYVGGNPTNMRDAVSRISKLQPLQSHVKQERQTPPAVPPPSERVIPRDLSRRELDLSRPERGSAPRGSARAPAPLPEAATAPPAYAIRQPKQQPGRRGTPVKTPAWLSDGKKVRDPGTQEEFMELQGRKHAVQGAKERDFIAARIRHLQHALQVDEANRDAQDPLDDLVTTATGLDFGESVTTPPKVQLPLGHPPDVVDALDTEDFSDSNARLIQQAATDYKPPSHPLPAISNTEDGDIASRDILADGKIIQQHVRFSDSEKA